MGIIEIILTVVAWRKGWHVIALLPVVVALVVGALMVLGGAPDSVLYVCDIVLIGVLGVMAAQQRKVIERSTSR